MAKPTIAGRCGILTGASSGIGRALATQLVRQGARLIVVARRTERLEELARGLAGASGDVDVLAGDITLPEVREQTIARAQALFGRLDLVINNAGIGASGRFASASADRLRRVMEVNFFAPAEMIRLAIPLLQLGQRPMVVNVGSILGHRGIPLCAEYCASKFALQGLSESLRAEFSQSGIDLLMVSPGTTETEFFDVAIDAAEPPWPKSKGVAPEVVARHTVTAIRARRHEVVIGPSGKFLVGMNRLFPRVVDRFLARYG